jgi:hypothetical protein
MKLRSYAILYSSLGYTLLFLLKKYYRPFIYENHIFDFYFADTFPSLLSVPAIFSFILIFNYDAKKAKLYIVMLTGVSLFYELISPTFDLKDILAVLFGASMAFLIDRQCFRLNNSQKQSIIPNNKA